MTKLRAKNLKPKLQPDFKKKTVKVGRKVARSNATVVKVQSKHIQVPIQAQMLAKKVENESQLVEKILKQLSHHSTLAREAAIEELGQFMDSSVQAQLFVSQAVPGALELLYDEEKGVRKAMLKVFSSILSKFPASSFEPVTSIMLTYLCSGLTSLVKV